MCYYFDSMLILTTRHMKPSLLEAFALTDYVLGLFGCILCQIHVNCKDHPWVYPAYLNLSLSGY